MVAHALGRWEHADPWGLLGSQLKPCDEIQAKLGNLSQKKEGGAEEERGMKD